MNTTGIQNLHTDCHNFPHLHPIHLDYNYHRRVFAPKRCNKQSPASEVMRALEQVSVPALAQVLEQVSVLVSVQVSVLVSVPALVRVSVPVSVQGSVQVLALELEQVLALELELEWWR